MFTLTIPKLNDFQKHYFTIGITGMLSPRGQCGLEAKFFGLGLGLVVPGLGLVLGLTGFGLGLTEVGLVAS